jgi:hypothetical protein
MTARNYCATSSTQSIAASATRVAVQLATGASVTNRIFQIDVSFDSVATGSGAVPFLVQLVRPTAASSGGSTVTPTKLNKALPASATTGRKADTTAGTGATVVAEYEVSPAAGFPFPYQLPLGRELEMDVSDFFEVKIVAPAGITTCNYNVNVWFEE